MRKVGDALLALNSFSMHGQLKDDDGSTVDWKMEFVKPDRQHTRMTTRRPDDREHQHRLIRLRQDWDRRGRRARIGSDQASQIVPLSQPR